MNVNAPMKGKVPAMRGPRQPVTKLGQQPSAIRAGKENPSAPAKK